VPYLKEQQKIASVLITTDKEMELLEAKLAHLKEEKKGINAATSYWEKTCQNR